MKDIINISETVVEQEYSSCTAQSEFLTEGSFIHSRVSSKLAPLMNILDDQSHE